MILDEDTYMRIGNQKATINNKVGAVEQKFVLDPVK